MLFEGLWVFDLALFFMLRIHRFKVLLSFFLLISSSPSENLLDDLRFEIEETFLT